MKSPENPLPSWRPRRPSAGLKNRLFRDQVPLLELSPWSLRWVAPAATCLLLFILLQHHSMRIGDERIGRPTGLAMVASNRITYLPDEDKPEWNRVDARSFEWTNLSGSTSSVSSFRTAN